MYRRLYCFAVLLGTSLVEAVVTTTCESQVALETSLLQHGLLVSSHVEGEAKHLHDLAAHRHSHSQAPGNSIYKIIKQDQGSTDSKSSVLEEGFFQLVGFLGIVCETLMLGPQIMLNFRRASTAGLSTEMILAWHVASLLATAYYLESRKSIWAIESVAVLSFCCAVVEAQILAYGPLYEECSNDEKTRKVLKWAGILIFVSLGAIALLASIISEFPWTEQIADGSSTLLFAAGFLPQFAMFISEWSVEGYHLNVTILDILGSICTTAVLLHDDGLSMASLLSAAPFLAIIVMHCILLMMLSVITCTETEKPMDDASSDAVSESDSLDRTLFSFSRSVTATAAVAARSVTEDLQPDCKLLGDRFPARTRTT
mmetsp:Transcript_93424/g.166223  ORF Transcript_93424/g.166223 Transcript_93424/m.166223 type:complete len:371 (+) Transcript_93424:54-1166(+)